MNCSSKASGKERRARLSGLTPSIGARDSAVLLACVGLALTFGLVAADAASAPSFAGPKNYATGMFPVSVALGDLNGDGKPDLAAVSEEGRASVLTNKGNGSFEPKIDYATGGTIVFTASAGGGLALMRPDGSGLRRLRREGASPAWSPDGRQIAFSRSFGIYLVGPSGRGLRRVTHAKPNAGDVSPAWSPDGRRIAFESRPASGLLSTLEVVNVDGSGRRKIRRDGGSPAWSPDGRWIAFSTSTGQIWLMHPDGSGARRLVRSALNTGLAWSPYGRWIVFSRSSATKPLPQLWLVNLHGKGLHRLTGNRLSHYGPTWSPDGHWIAFQGTIDSPAKDPPAHIYVINAAGGGQRRLTRTTFAFEPDWSSNKLAP